MNGVQHPWSAMPAAELILRNARIVRPDGVVAGDVLVRDGRIADIAAAAPGHGGEDLGGDWLLPGLVELHTDHLESHYAPRPGVRWNADAALLAHDAQIAASGITTVFDALRVGTDEDVRFTAADMRTLADAVAAGRRAGRLRAEHFIHLRCEVSSADALAGFETLEGSPDVRLASLMDHTPGQRQFTSLEAHRIYYQGKTGMSDAEFDLFVERRRGNAAEWSEPNRAAIAERCRDRGIRLASHDDATVEHVAEARRDGATLCEFPTTLEAATAARASGMQILMGAPNVVRGGSHSGNVAAGTLAAAGLLDVLSSDYVPFSLIHAAFLLAEALPGGIAAAVQLVSVRPADAAGLADRGAIEIDRRADLVQVSAPTHGSVEAAGAVPVVRRVWREGRRVA